MGPDVIRVVDLGDPLDHVENLAGVPEIDALPTSDEWPTGSTVICDGDLWRRCAAPIVEVKQRLRDRILNRKPPAPPKPSERAPGEWTRVSVCRYEIVGQGSTFNERFRGAKTWHGYETHDKALRDARGLARTFDARLIDEVD